MYPSSEMITPRSKTFPRLFKDSIVTIDDEISSKFIFLLRHIYFQNIQIVLQKISQKIILIKTGSSCFKSFTNILIYSGSTLSIT